jgi:hypothetical protein
MNAPDQKRQLEERLIEKAMKDEQFRENLLLNPKSIIEQELGIVIPDQMKIHVLEETVDSLYLVLPAGETPAGSDELTESELESVSGGGLAFYSGNLNCSAGTLCACTG